MKRKRIDTIGMHHIKTHNQTTQHIVQLPLPGSPCSNEKCQSPLSPQPIKLVFLPSPLQKRPLVSLVQPLCVQITLLQPHKFKVSKTHLITLHSLLNQALIRSDDGKMKINKSLIDEHSRAINRQFPNPSIYSARISDPSHPCQKQFQQKGTLFCLS